MSMCKVLGLGTAVPVASAVVTVILGVGGCAPRLAPPPRLAAAAPQDDAQLFEKETFGGNGRTCSTCHSAQDRFSTTPATARQRFAANHLDPLFQPIDSDDGAGNAYARLLAHATIRVRIPLKCPNIWLEDEPAATSVVVNRGIPELLDTPALDATLMSDGRVDSLEQQALDAIRDHAQATKVPDLEVLRHIANYQRGDQFFSSAVLRDFARGGPRPELPAGTTAAEIRGRVHYLPVGLCGMCHSGPMLNTTTVASIAGPGQRYNNIRTGELVPDQIINPFLRWHVVQADGTHRVFHAFADPGRMLITCKREDLTKFKIRSLWNVKNTAPYFHDNSAKTLEDVIAHYRQLFILRKIPVTEQDLSDILAYLKLL